MISEKTLVVMPTIPGRPHAPKVIEGFLKQGADVRVYLNGFDRVPDEWPKDVDYCLSPIRRGPIVRYSKKAEGYDVVAFVDDDIYFPDNYLSTSISNLKLLGPKKAAVTWHSSWWPRVVPKPKSRDRRCMRLDSAQPRGWRVPYVGSGALVLWASDFNKLARAPSNKFEFEDDIWISSRLAKNGVKAFRPPSEKGWITAVPGSEDTLYRRAKADKFHQRDRALSVARRASPDWDIFSRCLVRDVAWEFGEDQRRHCTDLDTQDALGSALARGRGHP